MTQNNSYAFPDHHLDEIPLSPEEEKAIRAIVDSAIKELETKILEQNAFYRLFT